MALAHFQHLIENEIKNFFSLEEFQIPEIKTREELLEQLDLFVLYLDSPGFVVSFSDQLVESLRQHQTFERLVLGEKIQTVIPEKVFETKTRQIFLELEPELQKKAEEKITTNRKMVLYLVATGNRFNFANQSLWTAFIDAVKKKLKMDIDVEIEIPTSEYDERFSQFLILKEYNPEDASFIRILAEEIFPSLDTSSWEVEEIFDYLEKNYFS